MQCKAMYGPDSGGAHWICRTEHIQGALLAKADGAYLLNSDGESINKIQSWDNGGDEIGDTREVTYCPKCKLWAEKEE